MNKRAPLSVCPVTHEAHHWPTELENQGQRQRPLACAYLPPLPTHPTFPIMYHHRSGSKYVLPAQIATNAR